MAGTEASTVAVEAASEGWDAADTATRRREALPVLLRAALLVLSTESSGEEGQEERNLKEGFGAEERSKVGAAEDRRASIATASSHPLLAAKLFVSLPRSPHLEGK